MARQSDFTSMPIKKFCNRVMDQLIIKCNNADCKEIQHSRRIVVFLTQHPSVKTTADLTSTVFGEFVSSCEELSPPHRLQMLERLRLFSNLAIEWGLLNRNPFEEYPLTPKKNLAKSYDKPKLTADEVSRLMAYLEARKDTWAGHRFYAFAASVLYAGLTTSEALKLTLTDCDLVQGVIRVPGRSKSDRSKSPPEVRISPVLAQILSGWIPVLSRGDIRRGGHRPYGSKRAEDGRTYIPDEAEQQVLSDMLRWREEGMSVRQITRELNSRGIPTKQGKKGWNRASVTMILNRPRRTDSHGVDPANEPDSRKEGREGSDSLYLFPILEYRTAHPAREGRNRGGIRVELLREACKALGIKVTLASLRRFYYERDRRIPGQGWDDRERSSVRVGRTGHRSPSVTTWLPERCPVTITSDEIVMIDGKQKNLSYPQFIVIKTLLDSGPSGLTGVELISNSGRSGYRNILKTLARDEDWNHRIRWAGSPHGRYRLVMPGDK